MTQSDFRIVTSWVNSWLMSHSPTGYSDLVGPHPALFDDEQGWTKTYKVEQGRTRSNKVEQGRTKSTTCVEGGPPLVPTEPPADVWIDLAYPLGSNAGNTYMHVVIDKLSRFSKVVKVRGISAQPNNRMVPSSLAAPPKEVPLTILGSPMNFSSSPHNFQYCFILF